MKRKFVATIDGEKREFHAELAGDGRITVFMADKVTELDVSRIGEDHYLALVGNKVHHLGFTRQGCEWQAYEDGEVLSFELRDEKMLLRDSLGGALGGGGGGEVKSPMPGRVVKILVEAGTAVKAGDPVVVVEAMKMENEFKAKKAGTVKEIKVKPGDTVEGGAILLTIE